MIIGETGVGKTLYAKAIHARSPRKSLKLSLINFSILSEREQRVALLGGEPPELTTTRRSSLEPPSTLILKHIDHANPFLQERLAEALTTRKLTRLGSDSVQLVLSKSIFTLKKPLLPLYRSGKIIESLYHKLEQYKQISIPPLRKRKEDIPLLVDHFLNQFLDGCNVLGPDRAEAVRSIKTGGRIEAGLLGLLRQQRWEQNVVQLKAYIRSLLLPTHQDSIREREKIELMKMFSMIEEGSEFSLHQSLGLIQGYIIDRALHKCNGNKSQTAALLGLSDRSIRRRSN